MIHYYHNVHHLLRIHLNAYHFQLLLPLSVALAGGAAWWGHWPVTVFLLAVTIQQSAAYGAFWLYCRRTAKGGAA